MQILALMMAVMMLGMPLVNGYHTDVGPGEQGARGRTESMLHSPARIESNREVLVAGKGANPAVPHRNPPVEPGGSSARRILQQVQLGMEDLAEEQVKVGAQRNKPEGERNPGREEWNLGSGGSGQVDRPKREAAQKAMDALKKGADATRGRGRRKGRMYQRTGVRN